jgi:hypothetical protein
MVMWSGGCTTHRPRLRTFSVSRDNRETGAVNVGE